MLPHSITSMRSLHRLTTSHTKLPLIWKRTMSMEAASSRPHVHIIGLGGIGTFAAHSLSEVPASITPSITLLLHRPSLVDEFIQRGRQIKLETREKEIVCHHENYHLELVEDGQWHKVQIASEGPHETTQSWNKIAQDDIIRNLIVTVKGPQTASALRSLKHRLDASSNILFLQNGGGMIEEANKDVFPEPETRPNYITGVISHGITLNAPFDITHTGFAATSLGPVPRSTSNSTTESGQGDVPRSYLLDALPLSARMNATSYSFLDVFQIQLEKITVNAFCNPLCALNDAKNGFLFTMPETRRALLTEISSVILALPQLKGVPGVSERFSVDKLEATVNDIIQKTAETTCSMVVDLRKGQKTEIRNINGYWCQRGREVGVPTPINDDLVRQILERQGDVELAKDYKSAG